MLWRATHRPISGVGWHRPCTCLPGALRNFRTGTSWPATEKDWQPRNGVTSPPLKDFRILPQSHQKCTRTRDPMARGCTSHGRGSLQPHSTRGNLELAADGQELQQPSRQAPALITSRMGSAPPTLFCLLNLDPPEAGGTKLQALFWSNNQLPPTSKPQATPCQAFPQDVPVPCQMPT